MALRVVIRRFAHAKPEWLRTCKPSPENCAKCGKFPCGNVMKREYVTKQPWHQHPFFWFGAAFAGYLAFNLEIIPISNRLRLRMVPGFVDDYLARKYDQDLLNGLQDKFLAEDTPEHVRVLRVGTNLTSVCGMRPLTYHVVDDPSERNAFVSAGGHVVVYTGLLNLLEQDDMLAAILGHEIGHYIAHHVAERIGFDWIAKGVQNLISDATPVRYLSAIAMTMPMSRLIEKEADYMGLLLMAGACYNIDAAYNVWNMFHSMKNIEAAEHHSTVAHVAQLIADSQDVEASRSFTDRYLSTHPTHSERLTYFQSGSPWMRRAEAMQEAAQCPCCHGSGEAPGARQQVAMCVDTKPIKLWRFVFNKLSFF